MPPGQENLKQPAVPGPAGGYRNAPVSAPSPSLPLPGLPPVPGGSGTLVVDLSALTAAVQAAEAAVGQAQRAAADAEDATSRSGAAPWGDDPGLGQAFGAVFAGPRTSLAETVRELPSLFEQLADNLEATQRGFAGAQNTAVDMITDLARRSADAEGAS
jgi:hypothetical protein